MKLEEAIEILIAKRKDDKLRGASNSADACQLGIEALKHIDLARRSRDVRIIDHLPGETEE